MPGTWKNWIIAIFSSSGTPKWEQQIKPRRTRTRSERGKAVNREGTTLIGKSENSPSTTTVPRQNKYAGAFINWSPDTSSTHSPHYNNDCHCLLSSPSDQLGLSNGRTKYRPPTRVFAQSNCKSEIQAEGKVHVKDSRKEHLFRPIILILVSATTDADRPFVSHFHTAIRRDSILNSNQKFATSSATCGLLFPLTFSPVPDHELQPLQSTPPPFPTAHYNPSDSNAE